MTKTIKIVRPPNEWQSDKGLRYFINVTFEDSSEGSLMCFPDNKDAAYEALKALVDKPSDFTLEARDKRNGTDQWKIKDYPGKPGKQGGGGRQYVDNSPSIEAQNALNNAVALVSRYTELYGLEDAIRLVREVAPQLHAVTQNLKNGGSARPSTSAAAQPAGEQGTSLPERSTPAGAADTWEGIEADVKASGEARAYGEGSQPSPEPSGGESEVNRKEPPANGSSPDLLPTEELEELWNEALARDLTRARVVAILKKAGQPIASADDVDARQLRSLLGVTR